MRQVRLPAMLRWRPFLALALLAFGCATNRLAPVPAGGVASAAAGGVVIGRAEWVGSDGTLQPCTGCVFGIPSVLEWRSTESSVRYEIAFDGMAGDFAVAPPAGGYRWQEPQCGAQALSFTPQPGRVLYLGTIRIARDNPLACSTVSVVDEYDATVARFRAGHPEFQGEVEKHLMVLWSCDPNGECRLAP